MAASPLRAGKSFVTPSTARNPSLAAVAFNRVNELPARTRKRLQSAALEHGKAVVLGPVFDTIKRVQNALVTDTLDRDQLRQPLAWAWTPENDPVSDPPPSDWFIGAAALEGDGS